MKKRLIKVAAFCLILTLALPGAAFAANTAAPVKLSLEDTYDKMLKDSPTATLMALQKKMDQATARGSSENLSDLKKAESAISAGLEGTADEQTAAQAASWQLDTSNKKMLEANRNFANEQIPRNEEARVNALKSTLLSTYYQLQLSDASLELAKDNMDLNNTVLTNTNLMYELGTKSKSDVLKAEVNANDAKAAYTGAVNARAKGFMDFNQSMGHNIQQTLELTSKLEAVELPTATLEETLANALKNRNEIHGADYNLEMAQFNFNTYQAYPANSAKYMSAFAQLEVAKQAAVDKPIEVEIDVRNKYAVMMEKHEAVQLGKASVANADETVRLADLQYNSGLITLTDMEGLLLSAYQTKQNYQNTLLQYAVAVNDYNLAGTVGTQTVSL